MDIYKGCSFATEYDNMQDISADSDALCIDLSADFEGFTDSDTFCLDFTGFSKCLEITDNTSSKDNYTSPVEHSKLEPVQCWKVGTESLYGVDTLMDSKLHQYKPNTTNLEWRCASSNSCNGTILARGGEYYLGMEHSCPANMWFECEFCSLRFESGTSQLDHQNEQHGIEVKQQSIIPLFKRSKLGKKSSRAVKDQIKSF